jgi:hypothetical protein
MIRSSGEPDLLACRCLWLRMGWRSHGAGRPSARAVSELGGNGAGQSFQVQRSVTIAGDGVRLGIPATGPHLDSAAGEPLGRFSCSAGNLDDQHFRAKILEAAETGVVYTDYPHEQP